LCCNGGGQLTVNHYTHCGGRTIIITVVVCGQHIARAIDRVTMGVSYTMIAPLDGLKDHNIPGVIGRAAHTL
jgi:hypothetical protein